MKISLRLCCPSKAVAPQKQGGKGKGGREGEEERGGVGGGGKEREEERRETEGERETLPGITGLGRQPVNQRDPSVAMGCPTLLPNS